MNPEFWKARWSEGKIGFHEGRPNELLAAHAERLGEGRVLVPLCGKTEDLAFLASRGHQVVGIELVEDAVRAFFAEHALAPAVERRGELTVYAAGAITLIVGDLFAVSRDDVGAIDALYDRAALIALPPDVRPRYVAHLRTLVPAGARGMLVTLDYDQSRKAGPPFAVPDAEVRAHYPGAELLVERPTNRAGNGPELEVIERCYAITP